MFPKNEEFSFSINEDFASTTFYFMIDQSGTPIKVRDDYFGISYQVVDGVGRICVAKLLYSKRISVDLSLISITEELVRQFPETFSIEQGSQILKRLSALSHPLNWASLMKELVVIDMPKEQLLFMLSYIEEHLETVVANRFAHDLNSVRNIREELASYGQLHNFSGLMDVIGGTNKFRQSQAYKALTTFFQDSGIEVSNLVLVTPLYEMTLKDLLERETHIHRIHPSALHNALGNDDKVLSRLSGLSLDKTALIRSIEEIELPEHQKTLLYDNLYRLTGHQLLAYMDFPERLAAILPYVLEIAYGLKCIHHAGMVHLNLSPATVLVKQEGDKVGACIDYPNILSTSEPSHRFFPPLGEFNHSRGIEHYRSPEQKHWQYIYDAEIGDWESEDSQNEQIILLVRDNKFRDDLVESNDFLVFSKDVANHPYIIQHIYYGETMAKITLQSRGDGLPIKMNVGEKTQIIIYKQQGIRSDLFGLGAIFFELLTGGFSPELFYDAIKSFDTPIESVHHILELYRRIIAFQSEDSRYLQVFAPFRSYYNLQHTPPPVVEFILRCMLYRAKDTFYDETMRYKWDNSGLQDLPIDLAINHLRKLASEFSADYFGNALASVVPIKEAGVATHTLLNYLESLQNIHFSELPSRLAQGIWLFRRIVDVARRFIEEENVYFAQMLPENIVILESSSEFFAETVNFRTREDYEYSLKNDLVTVDLEIDSSNPYFPSQFTSIRRIIEIKAAESKQRDNVFEYRFITPSLTEDRPSRGDWIVADGDLWMIVSCDKHHITLTSASYHRDETIEIAHFASNRCVYYKNINPCTYYLNILGVYIYKIFFEYLEGNEITSLSFVNSIWNTLQFSGTKFTNNATTSTAKTNVTIDSMFKFIGQIFLKLTFSDYVDSYHQRGQKDLQRILYVLKDVQTLQYMIEQFIGLPPGKLNEPPATIATERINLLRQNIPTHLPEQLHFNNLVLFLIDESIDPRQKASWWRMVSRR